MNKAKMITVFAAAALLILISGTGSRAEVTAEKQEYRGRVTEITWKDENGTVTAGPNGYASVRYEYEYQKVTEKYYDAEGFPYAVEGGYYGKSVTRDSRDMLSLVDYLGIDGKLTMTEMGYARISYQFFTFGAERTVVFHGANGRAVMVPSLGYSQVENQYSGKTLTARIYMDERGNKVDLPAGYAVMKQRLNKGGRVIKISYEHADGTPAAGPDGWSWSTIERDADQRITKIEYFDTNGNQTVQEGCAREEYQYSKDGLVTMTRFDLQGNRIFFGGTAVSVQRKMKNDQILEETYLNEAGEPASLPAGYATAVYTYNAAGQLELTQYKDAAGQKVRCSQGYSAVRQIWDVEGRLIQKSYLDENGQAVNHNSTGVSEERYEYDEEGRMTGVGTYDAAGKPVVGDQ